jgi:actin-related protein
VDIINEWMKSPLDIAKDKGLTEIVEALTKKAHVSKRMSRSSTRAIEIVKKEKDKDEEEKEEKEKAEQEAERKKLEEEKEEKKKKEEEEAEKERARAQQEQEEQEEERLRMERLEQETRAANVSAMDALKDLEEIIAEPVVQKAPREPPVVTATPQHIQAPAATDGGQLLIRPQPVAPKPEPTVVATSVTRPFNNAPTKSVIMARPKAKQRNPNRRPGGSDLTSSLVDACKEGDLTRMKSLISQGAPVNKRCPKTGNTPLIAAVLSGSNIAIMFILDQPSVDLNVPNKAGDTVLHVLAATHNDDAAVWLIQRGADAAFKNALGQTPLDISISLQQAVANCAFDE